MLTEGVKFFVRRPLDIYVVPYPDFNVSIRAEKRNFLCLFNLSRADRNHSGSPESRTPYSIRLTSLTVATCTTRSTLPEKVFVFVTGMHHPFFIRSCGGQLEYT